MVRVALVTKSQVDASGIESSALVNLVLVTEFSSEQRRQDSSSCGIGF
ncbi:MAG: hypothetical protein HRT36_07970 [Alphaproteobacteria bacterium]|nr:hypothetical protein [Alphaproteobacteria bacterium]